VLVFQLFCLRIRILSFSHPFTLHHHHHAPFFLPWLGFGNGSHLTLFHFALVSLSSLTAFFCIISMLFGIGDTKPPTFFINPSFPLLSRARLAIVLYCVVFVISSRVDVAVHHTSRHEMCVSPFCPSHVVYTCVHFLFVNPFSPFCHVVMQRYRPHPQPLVVVVTSQRALLFFCFSFSPVVASFHGTFAQPFIIPLTNHPYPLFLIYAHPLLTYCLTRFRLSPSSSFALGVLLISISLLYVCPFSVSHVSSCIVLTCFLVFRYLSVSCFHV